MAANWTELTDFPLTHSWKRVVMRPIMYDKNKIMAMSSSGSLCAFSIDSNKWNKLYTVENTNDNFSVALDKQNNTLYIIGFNRKTKMYTLCIKTGKVNEYETHVQIGRQPTTRFINGKFHVIGGQRNGKHYLWDDKKYQLKLLHTVTETGKGLQSASLIHVESQNKLILLGGFDWSVRKSVDRIKVYSITDNEWKELLNKNGNKVKLPLALNGFGCILTRDERYVVIFGGSSGSDGGEEVGIYYLDLRTFKWTKSLIECPVNNDYTAVLTENNDVHIFGGYEMFNKHGHWKIALREIIPQYGFELICGYVRLYCNIDFNVDLIKLIHKWY